MLREAMGDRVAEGIAGAHGWIWCALAIFTIGCAAEVEDLGSASEAITHGELDGDDHPAVVLILMELVEAERVRMRSNPYLVQINTPGFTGGFSLLLSNNASSGGTCFGDSGGPNFLGNNDSRLVAGVTSFGLNGACGGTGGVFRVDRGDVLDFIDTTLEDWGAN